MRKTFVAALALTILGAAYYAYPYWTLHRIQTAVIAGDADRLEPLVDWIQVRSHLKADMRAMLLDQVKPEEAGLGALGTMFGAAMIDPMVDAAVSPAGIQRLWAQHKKPDVVPALSVLSTRFLSPSLYRVRFHPADDPETEMTASLELAGFTWRLTRVTLPTEGVKLFASSASSRPDTVAIPPAQRAAAPDDAETLSRQLKTLDEEIATLSREIEADASRSEAAVSTLSKIVIKGARFYYSGDRYLREPTIDFSIINGADRAVRRVYFHGRLETPGRTIPWVDAPFNYEIRGGLEPGETQRLRLTPNRFGPWGNRDLDGRKDLVLTVTVTDFEDAEGKRILADRGTDLTTSRTRLEALQSKRAVLAEKLAVVTK